MQIREQGRKIQLLRSEYDSHIKKCRQTLIATIPNHVNEFDKVTLLVKDLLTEEEINQLTIWLETRYGERKERNTLMTVKYAHLNLDLLAKAIINSATDEAQLTAIEQAINGVVKSIRKSRKLNIKTECL